MHIAPLMGKNIFSWPPIQENDCPFILCPPHLEAWKDEAMKFLSGIARPGTIGFATSGSSGSPTKAILFTRDALECCARGAIAHMHAEKGDWCCPLPLWHVGGAMTVIRSSLSGSSVHILEGKWNPARYATLMRETKSSWSSLVPAQVIDLIHQGIAAPEGIRCILVGGGQLDTTTGVKARELGWPVVQSYGMTESGSQMATASPSDPFHTDKLSILPHWEAQITENGRLSFRGEGRFYGIISSHGAGFRLETIDQQEWWENSDLVQIENRKLTFLGRADRTVKILGELVDVDRIEREMTRLCKDLVIEILPHPRNGYELVACHPNKTLLHAACTQWNASTPGFQRISSVAYGDIPKNPMGKTDREQLRSTLSQTKTPFTI